MPHRTPITRMQALPEKPVRHIPKAQDNTGTNYSSKRINKTQDPFPTPPTQNWLPCWLWRMRSWHITRIQIQNKFRPKAWITKIWPPNWSFYVG